MKLLIAADIFPPESGGPATYSVTLANELTKQGVDVKIVSLNPDTDDTKVKCPVFAVKSSFKPLRYWQYYKLLLEYGEDCDVIFAMGPVNAGWLANKVATKLHKKFVVKVVGDYAWEQGMQRFGVNDLIDEFQKKKYGWRVELLRNIESRVVRSANLVITPSEYLKKIVMGWGVRAEKVRVVYNAVDFKTVVPISKPAEEQWIVSVARLVPWKGMDTLITCMEDIIRAYPNAKLKIIGDGPERKNLATVIHGLELDTAVELLGNLPNQITLSYLRAADVFVLNSGYEGLSHVLLEAANAGTAVVASDVGGNPEVVARENLFAFNKPDQIKEKIIAALRDSNRQPIDLSQFQLPVMIQSTKETLEQL